MSTLIKAAGDIQKMRLAGRLASQVLDYIAPFVKPGITTGALDELCHQYMVNIQQAVPAPLYYTIPGCPPFPKATCISINNVICHGIPGNYTLVEGDIVNIDITVIKEGYHGDTSRMFLVGKVAPQAKKLCRVAYQCMLKAIEEIRPGAHIGNLGYAIQTLAEKNGYSVVREFCGHGIGRQFHEEPQVLHYGTKNTGMELKPGMIFTIEPMINEGRPEVKWLSDGWTVVTKDGSLSAQWEHTVLVTEKGYEILTTSKPTQSATEILTSKMPIA